MKSKRTQRKGAPILFVGLTCLTVCLVGFNAMAQGPGKRNQQKQSNVCPLENKTAISLKWKDSTQQVQSISSATGNLYKQVSHHGPAVENEFAAYRFYFDHKVSIDVYNKVKPGLELEEAAWYPTKEQQQQGWGADQYKVWSTVGCGGVRLWDGSKEVFLNPVTKRTARVCKEANHSYMEMLSEGIPYMGDTIDVLVRLTVFSGRREAKVEAFAFSAKPVKFLTGLNFHPQTETAAGLNYVASWSIHPEDVAAFQMKIGAAVWYNPADFEPLVKVDDVFRLVSKPTHYLSTWITTACEKEVGMADFAQFSSYLNAFKP